MNCTTSKGPISFKWRLLFKPPAADSGSSGASSGSIAPNGGNNARIQQFSRLSPEINEDINVTSASGHEHCGSFSIPKGSGVDKFLAVGHLLKDDKSCATQLIIKFLQECGGKQNPGLLILPANGGTSQVTGKKSSSYKYLVKYYHVLFYFSSRFGNGKGQERLRCRNTFGRNAVGYNCLHSTD